MMATTKAFVARAKTVMGDAEIAAVEKLVRTHGAREAGRMLGLSRSTVLSIIGRVGIYPGNAALVRQRLAELKIEC